MNYVL